jgi:hypothetical protein
MHCIIKNLKEFAALFTLWNGITGGNLMGEGQSAGWRQDRVLGPAAFY